MSETESSSKASTWLDQPKEKSSYGLRAKLKEASGGDGKLQKSEFKVLLLSLEIHIKQAVLDEIFAACDIDGDGGLTADEIITYLNSTSQPKTIGDAVAYTARLATSNFVWWFAVAFYFAAWVGVISFIYNKKGKQLAQEWGIVGAWFFFFGAVYFFKLLLDSETSKYDTMVRAKAALKKCIDNDPMFFDIKAGSDGTMDKSELNGALEEQALYVPQATLTKIFIEIDDDETGLISKDEIAEFAQTHKEPTQAERRAAISDAFVRTWGFWSLICWLIGSIFFLVGVHTNYAGHTEPPLPKNFYFHLYGIGSTLYLLFSIFMIPMLADEVKDYLESIEQMSKAFASKRELKRGQSSSDEELFQSLDVNKEGESDGGLDPMELCDVLIEKGVVIPYDTFLELFEAADESGDGKLQMEEFTKFIAIMQIDSDDPWQYRMRALKRVPYAPSFFGFLMYFIGGLAFTVGSYLDTSNSVEWYFVGSIGYGMIAGKGVFVTIKGYWSHFHAVEAGKAELRAHIAGQSIQ